MSCSVYEWGLDRGQECLGFFSLLFFLFSVSLNPLLTVSFKLFWELVIFWDFCKILKIHEFQVPLSLLGDWLQTHFQAVKKLYCI